MAARATAPFLTLILDNVGYRASQRPVQDLFPQGVSVRTDAYPGVRFDQPPDYAAIARARRVRRAGGGSGGACGSGRPRAARDALRQSRGARSRTRSDLAAVLDLALAPIQRMCF